MDRVYENSSATWDETTVFSFLDAFLFPHMEKIGGGENGVKRTALLYDILHAHRIPAVLAWYKSIESIDLTLTRISRMIYRALINLRPISKRIYQTIGAIICRSKLRKKFFMEVPKITNARIRQM